MGKMFEDRSLPGIELVQHWLSIILIAAPENMMVRTHHILDRIKLYETELPDSLCQIKRAGRCLGQSLSIEPEPACLPVADP